MSCFLAFQLFKKGINKGKYFCMPINPIPTGGGHFWPQQPEAVWHIRSFMTGVTKIHDFVYFSMCLVPLELFLKKKLWNFKKWKKINFTVVTPKGPPFGKKIEKIKNFSFFIKNYTISTWIWILHVLSFLLRYITSVFLKIFNFSIF